MDEETPRAPRHERPKLVCIGTVNVWAYETHDTSEHPYVPGEDEPDGPVDLTLSDVHGVEVQIAGRRAWLQRPLMPLEVADNG